MDFESVNRIILTHQDIDHIGGLPDFISVRKGEIEVLAHQEDRPYIEGNRPLIELDREWLAQMPESMPASQRQRLERMFSTTPSGKVDRILHDGEELPLCGGITDFCLTRSASEIKFA